LLLLNVVAADMKIALQNLLIVHFRVLDGLDGCNGLDGCDGLEMCGGLNYVHQIYLAYLKPLGVRLGSRLIF